MKRLVFALCLALAAVACGDNPASPSNTALVIVEFAVDNPVLVAGQTTAIHWNVVNADARRIESSHVGVGDVGPSGTVAINPPFGVTWYRLTATKRGALVQRTVTVTR